MLFTGTTTPPAESATAEPKFQVSPAPYRVQILLGSVALADTTSALLMTELPKHPPRYYFPKEVSMKPVISMSFLA